MGKLIFNAQAEPVAPVGESKHTMYVDYNDGKVKVKDSAGCVCALGGGGSGGGGVPGDIWSTGEDGDCTITACTVLEAKEYNFNNLIICNCLCFCGPGIPVIKANYLCVRGPICLGADASQIGNTTCYYNVAGCVRNISNQYPTPIICMTYGIGTDRCGYGGAAGQSGMAGTCGGGNGGAGATGAGGGGGGGGSGGTAGGNATENCGGAGGNGGTGRWSGGNGGYGELRGGNGGNGGGATNCFAGSGGSGGPSACCGGNGGRPGQMNLTSNITLNCEYVIFGTGSGGKGGDGCYRGGNGGCACMTCGTAIMYVCPGNEFRAGRGGNGGNALKYCGGSGGKGGDLYGITICGGTESCNICFEIGAGGCGGNSLSGKGGYGGDAGRYDCSVSVYPNNSYQVLSGGWGGKGGTGCGGGNGGEGGCIMMNCTAKPGLFNGSLQGGDGGAGTRYGGCGGCGGVCVLLDNDGTWKCFRGYPGGRGGDAHSSLYGLILSAKCVDFNINYSTIYGMGGCGGDGGNGGCPFCECGGPGGDGGNGGDGADVHFIYDNITVYDYCGCSVPVECINCVLCVSGGAGGKGGMGTGGGCYKVSCGSSACEYKFGKGKDGLPGCTGRYCLIKASQ